jgi:hypothetical protein
MSAYAGADHSSSSVSRGSSSCSIAVARRDCMRPVANRWAVDTRMIWDDTRSAIVGSRPSSTTSGLTPHASSTTAMLAE